MRDILPSPDGQPVVDSVECRTYRWKHVVREQHQVRSQVEEPLRRLPLGIEQLEVIGLAVHKVQTVKIDILGRDDPNAAEIQHHRAVNEEPHIVGSAELNELGDALLIHKLCVDRIGEVLVVGVAFIAQKLVINRIEGGLDVRIDTCPVTIKGDAVGAGHVDSRHVVEPLVERGRGEDSAATAGAGDTLRVGQTIAAAVNGATAKVEVELGRVAHVNRFAQERTKELGTVVQD